MLEQLLLVFGEFLRRHRLHCHPDVTAAAPRHVGHALAAQAEGRAGLRAFGNLDGLVAVNAMHLDLAAECERREREGHGAVQVVAVALEELVVLHEDHHVEIAGRTALGARFAFAGQAQALSGGNPGRNLHRQLARLLNRAAAPAGLAGLGDHLAGAAALAASARHGEEALLKADLAGAAAAWAGGRRGAGRRAGSLAGVAGFLARDLDVRLDALGRLLELDLEVVAEVGAALRSAAA